MEVRPIPAFYCCYLLRSPTSPASLYIGSTPNPPRRLQQHNGKSKGGAVRTRRKTWEMDCIVTGFPSKIAALQFEWAWQNTHITRRIPATERISKVPEARENRKGNLRLPRPNFSMKDRLQNLHLLLRVPSFARWPLNVRFFCEDLWKKWQQTTRDLNLKEPLRSEINVVLDLKQVGVAAEPSTDSLSSHEKGKRRKEAIGRGGVDGVDIGYGSTKDHFEKSRSFFEGDQVIKCAVCASEISNPGNMAVTCPNGTCAAACHLSCLAQRFLRDEEGSGSLLPIAGRCPKCRMSTRWADLVMEMSLRARGAKEVARLTKQPRQKRTQAAKRSRSTMPSVDPSVSDESDEVSDDPLPDDWLPQEDDGEDRASIISIASEVPSPRNSSSNQLPLVVEDSEWDEAEEL